MSWIDNEIGALNSDRKHRPYNTVAWKALTIILLCMLGMQLYAGPRFTKICWECGTFYEEQFAECPACNPPESCR